jgi:hypothetical protein
MTTISPEGKIAVSGGASQKFTFSAKDGYFIGAVIVDGKNLSQAEIDAGSYTFRDIHMNHSIQVIGDISPRNMVLLVIDIEGGGYAEYSINGGVSLRYTVPAYVPLNSEVSLKAYAYEGSKFKEWRDGGNTITTSDYTVSIVTGPVKQIELFFSSDSGFDLGSILCWILAAIALIAIAATLIWYLLFYRRYYDVIKVAYSVEITGKDRARRKHEYRFSINGEFSGTVSYRVGEDGEWKVLLPMPDGEYAIPKGDVLDDLTIEVR